ncbi:MAG: UDP-N-acetylmuramate--L-alanine ligase [Ferruginibacter sp.]|nr:UDP-N-acetylmuramate--L-alanine ligase [Cytophagales bacterium]
MDLAQVRYVYFLGIGGIGMSALARWFRANGRSVAGYDRSPTALTDELQREGIDVHFEDDIRHIPAAVLAHPNQALVVYTPAIPGDHAEHGFLRERGYPIQKRSQVLGMLTANLFTVAVAGTHGKTTTSSMIAHLLKHAGRNCTAFLGGITQNYGTNLLLNEGTEAVVCVVEADEYDRSFLTLHPDVAVVTSTDADHLDIYGDQESLRQSFRDFVAQIKPGGKLFIRQGLQLVDANPKVLVEEYSLAEGEYRAERAHVREARFVFDAVAPQLTIRDIPMQVPGFHNVENALAAVAVGLHLGLDAATIRSAMATYRGVKRRFEYVLQTDRTVFIDDYAHHPTEIEAFLKSVRALYPDRKLTAIFQPHLFSRTRDFAEGFAESLGLADQLILLDIYPARELPMEGVNSKMVLAKVNLADKRMATKAELPALVRKLQPVLLVTIGAGDIDQCVIPLKEALEGR